MIQGVMDGLEAEVAELTMVPIDVEKEITVEAFDKVPLDQGIEVQVQVEVESEV